MSDDKRPGPHRLSRRYAAALGAAGAAAAVVLTGAASSATAAPAHPAIARNVNTLTETTTSASGKMTVTISYRTGRRGLTVLAVRYAGGAKAAVKHPALVFVFGPGPGPRQIRAPHPASYYASGSRRFRAIVLAFRLKPGQAAGFHGSLSAKALAAINAHGGLPVFDQFMTTLASGFRRPAGPGPVTIQPVLQVGMLLFPHRG